MWNSIKTLLLPITLGKFVWHFVVISIIRVNKYYVFIGLGQLLYLYAYYLKVTCIIQYEKWNMQNNCLIN